MQAPTAEQPLTNQRMIAAGTRYSWRVSASVALGVATATAVIVGALLVGDSMRGSLRSLTIERLGRTESIVAPGTFFPTKNLVGKNASASKLIYFPTGVVETRNEQGDIQRAGAVQIIGIDDDFWSLDSQGLKPTTLPDQTGVVLNASAATELGVSIGDQVTLRLPSEQAVPADSPLGRRDSRSEGLPRMKVLDIIADRGLGRFAISPSQAAPLNVYVSRSLMAETLDRTGQANLMLFDSLIEAKDLNIDLGSLGLSLTATKQTFADEVIFEYQSLTSDQLMLPETVVQRVTQALPSRVVVPVMTYLANAIERLDESGKVIKSVPYSTITAIDRIQVDALDPGATERIELIYDLPNGEVNSNVVPLVINDWTAKQLDAAVGTRLRVAYFEPEVVDGKEVERFFEAIVTQVVPITEPSKPYNRRRAAEFDTPPTVFNDPGLTPIVPGVTDQNSISDWDLPFPLEREISKADDQYWNNYRLTPKAFLPLEAGRRLFGSRFGDTTSLRIGTDGKDDPSELRSIVVAALKPASDELGWSPRPIRMQQLAASNGTTPFDGLFLALSFFVILSAVMLIAMLFRLGLVSRAKQFGTLMAIGWTPSRVRKLAMGEGMVVASVGVVIGIGGGIAYAVFVLWALRSWWVGAVTVPFLTFHWTFKSLAIGAVAGWLVAMATLAITIRWILKFDAQTLMSGRDLDTASPPNAKGSRGNLTIVGVVLLVIAIGLAIFGAVSGGQTAAGGFIGGGMMLLMAFLVLMYGQLRRPRQISSSGGATKYSLLRMTGRSAARHPMRSTMTIGLMATAAFLIIAIAAFQLQPTQQGTGGFTWIAQTAQPIYRDLSDQTVQSELLGPDAKELADTKVVGMRLRLGEDASCNNLYQATQPTVIGVPDDFDADFAWIATDEVDGGQSPWRLLDATAQGTEADPIPVVIDQNTAMWSLQMMGGVGEIRSFEYEAGKPVFFRVVGLLSNSMLQGRLIIGEANFQTTFQNISGYRLYLIGPRTDASKDSTGAVARVLENRLGDVGMDVSNADKVLAGMLAVQNTYLRTFQSLGALGLLLGTIGLAVAQLRSVLERRSELAVMRAIGFTRRRLATIVMGETAILLLAGIGCGAACAVIAVVPYSWVSGARPPITESVVTVIGIIVFGMLAGLVAVRRVSRMPLLESLRSE
ncbi:ABC transporter permease [Rubripirellula reticaptiva]|uniref:FtsX-like permease family protein n=1 Tax=Rubripirellula reticaptiva TaxID=2528013 RepID=A0A5C6F8I9_9BACT|nr:FtsX-like permease family protein [Rubripirellula reticaptiva]TWU58063.1 FtsX-like permease family protein [Rubripirellula reticaptiva]